jgi:hypothetical protein
MQRERALTGMKRSSSKRLGNQLCGRTDPILYCTGELVIAMKLTNCIRLSLLTISLAMLYSGCDGFIPTPGTNPKEKCLHGGSATEYIRLGCADPAKSRTVDQEDYCLILLYSAIYYKNRCEEEN